ncbi:mechanosensitive ion channel family protein [Tenacibaculum piscium]|uniref:Putative Small-conductance mechanosensitive channel n=1 Tax=Tenacibaculum piscium TaxID=1458515 RepID=A0A2H1YGW9_9FLAO|nr:mechanosensitive ion channel family protein [Tenacibaculum piscium]MBE7628916.1 mechanosensitive ion channel [Tenacibaculum piscium]MBE7671219.1 mechanosensitive ion channel [Tenacibaculum piscium]MBE7685063.1 mechanosensitive ion channel [Tenacibaculum piscium]MBE7689766.1 mechanosensitive ion channel [Tenacibaculum piscium]MCG8183631.1 mechanosensitive ion channel family protein [Tenacibaculum piscium]
MKPDLKKIFSDYFTEIATLLPNVITAIIILIIAVFIARITTKIIEKTTEEKWKDKLLANFFSQGIKWAIYLFGILSAFSVMGFANIASTIFAGAGVGAIIFGFAFKDIGENFISGIILAVKPPFDIGDIIEVQGNKGTVKQLNLRMTHLRNSDGKDIYVPNSYLLKNALVNYTKDGLLRVNFSIGIAPECDIETTRKLILNYLTNQKDVLKTPEFKVTVQELAEYTTNIQVHFWIDLLKNKELAEHYLGNTIRGKILTEIKEILDQNNIEMPSQVIEHKMYQKNTIQVTKTNI